MRPALTIVLSAAAVWAQSPRAQSPHSEGTHAAPGTVVRWSAVGTTRCGMKGKGWAALKGVCYYPIDLEENKNGKSPRILISRITAGRTHTAYIHVDPVDYGVEEITLLDIPQANPSPADLARDARDGGRLSKIFTAKEGPARFTLPLGNPAAKMPPPQSFGVARVFNGKPASEPHMGVDYPIPINTPILASAAGTVVMADDLFFEGNSVFLDHGNGLITMYLHLKDITVKPGQQVAKGRVLGHVGSTGRATGPHLFYGVRWHSARVDPKFLLEDPAKIPSIVDEPPAITQRKR